MANCRLSVLCCSALTHLCCVQAAGSRLHYWDLLMENPRGVLTPPPPPPREQAGVVDTSRVVSPPFTTATDL